MTSCRRLKSDHSLDQKFVALVVLSIKLYAMRNDLMSMTQTRS